MRIKRVLVIEDDRETSSRITDFLTKKGFEVCNASAGDEGIGICRAEKPDLVVLDLLLPGLEGLKFLEALRSDPEISYIPVVLVPVVTAGSGPDRQFHLGIIDWIRKPFEFDELAKVVGGVRDAVAPRQAGNNSVLIVEDDAVLAETTAEILSEKGYRPIVFHEGRDIAARLGSERPFLALVDIMLEDTDGMEVIKELKRNPATAGIAIVAVSARDLFELRRKYLLAGASEYYAVPFTLETFLNELHGSIMKYEMMLGKKVDRILIADDDINHAQSLMDILQNEGFESLWAKDGEEAMTLAAREMPDLILLDIVMPKKNGYEVFDALKSDILLRNIPVIMLTVRAKTREKVLGLEFGADDYVAKPYEVEELIARVRMVIRRTSASREINPLTKLPGSVAIDQAVNYAIKLDHPFAVLYIDINDFQAYNDYYGFTRGDEVIRALARCILDALNTLGRSDDFVGHVSGDDFVVVTHPERIEALCSSILRQFAIAMPEFYDAKDRKAGSITLKDRRGNEQRYPLLTLAIGAASSTQRKFSSVGEVAKIGAEMRAYAQGFKDRGGNFAVDKRKER